MRRTDTLVIGGGQAGLAVSWHLGRRGVDHQVLERGAVAQSWAAERWDSLRMITPNWMSELPGWSYRGERPRRVHDRGRGHAGTCRTTGAPSAPRCGKASRCCPSAAEPGGFQVRTTDGDWAARNVVIATGAAGRPHVPRAAAGLAPSVAQLPLRDYRRPEQLRRAASWSSAPRPRASPWPTSSPRPVAGSSSRSAATCGCPGSWPAGTSGGGCGRAAGSVERSTRSRTSTPPAASRASSCSAGPAPTAGSPGCRPAGSGWSAGSAVRPAPR